MWGVVNGPGNEMGGALQYTRQWAVGTGSTPIDFGPLSPRPSSLVQKGNFSSRLPSRAPCPLPRRQPSPTPSSSSSTSSISTRRSPPALSDSLPGELQSKPSPRATAEFAPCKHLAMLNPLSRSKYAADKICGS